MAARRKTVRWWILAAVFIVVLSAIFDDDDEEVPRATRPPVTTVAPAPSTTSSAPPASADRNQVEGIEPGFVNATSLNVRSRPDTAGAILFKVPRGTRIVPVSRVGDWLEVQLNDGSTGWVSAEFVSPAATTPLTIQQPTQPVRPEPAPTPKVDRDKVVQAIIDQSIMATGGSCPCPYNTDRAGRRCGARSAYSKPGGASPICFPDQVSDAMIRRFMAQ